MSTAKTSELQVRCQAYSAAAWRGTVAGHLPINREVEILRMLGVHRG